MRVQSVTGENMSRKVFDYRAQEQMELDVQFDKLDAEQKRRLNKALEQIQQETAQAAAERAVRWVYETAVPVLQKFAEKGSSLMTVEIQEGNLLTVELRNNWNFHILGEDAALKSVLSLAVFAEVSAQDGEVVLSLTFDGEKLHI